jgi:FG-GAP-like repeat/PQQ-like domain
MLIKRPLLFLFSLVTSTLPSSPGIAADVLTYHNDNARTGWNPSEVILTPSNVNASSFGLKFNLPVDGKVDAQPLYVSNNPVFSGGNSLGNRDLVIVATEHDTVYAFDADTGVLYWRASLLGTGETPSDNRGCGQVTPEIGITATPVIDRSGGINGTNGTIYVVAMSKAAGPVYHQRLHALNLATGQQSGLAEIRASYPGSGPHNDGQGHVIFDPGAYKERPGLLLLNGNVYTAWSSHCDIAPYTSWIIGYNEKTLAQTTVLNLDPNGHPNNTFLSDGSGNAFWNSGAGPAADANGNIYALSANGPFDTTLVGGFPSGGDFGDSFLKLSTQGSLHVSDYFTPFDQATAAADDTDLGSGGAVVLPDMVDASGKTRHLAVGAGKDTNIYLVDRDNMGKFVLGATSNSYIYQELVHALPGGEWATAAYFNGAVYYGPVGGALRKFTFNQARLNPVPTAMTSTVFAYPGVTPSISSSGNNSGIVWAYENPNQGSNQAVLHAYDATNLRELYNSNQNPTRDQFGTANKFITPTIANGKVFVGATNSVGVFGLLTTSVLQAAVDLNGDGKSDLVWFNQTKNLVAVWLMNGNTISKAAVLGNGPANSRIVSVADLVHSGTPQIIWYNGSSSFLAWSTTWSANNTPTTTENAFSLPADYPAVTFSDFDGDGLQDAVQWSQSTGAILIAKNNGSLTFTTQWSGSISTDWVLIGVADLNGNGRHELIWRNQVTGRVAAWVLSGFQPSQYVGYSTAPLSWRIRGIGRVDSTSAQGLIWRNAQTGQAAFWKMNTNGQLTGTGLPVGAPPWQIAGAPYFDGASGSPEILWVNPENGLLAVWRVNGVSIAPFVIADPSTSWIIQPAANGG